MQERIWEGELRAEQARREGKKVVGCEISMPTVQEVARKLVEDGWNLKSGVWKWG